MTIIDFGGPKIVFEDRGLVNDRHAKVTNEFYTDEGVIKDGQFFAKGKKEGEPLTDVAFSVQPGGPFGNFIDCVRSRKRENLNAEIIEGHRSALLCHLGNVSYQLDTEVPFNKQTDVLGSDKAVGAAFESMKRHVAKAGKVKLDEAKLPSRSQADVRRRGREVRRRRGGEPAARRAAARGLYCAGDWRHIWPRFSPSDSQPTAVETPIVNSRTAKLTIRS